MGTMDSYDATVGALLMAIFFNTFLYGFVTYQFLAYYRTKFDDGPWTKYMVLFLFILDTFYSASVIYLAWGYITANYKATPSLGLGDWPYEFTALGTALTALVTQTYLAHRIWRFTQCKILYGLVILLAIPSFALGMACSIESWTNEVLSEVPIITPIVVAWLTTQAFVDVFITVTLIIAFSRSRTGFRRMDTVLNRLIRGVIQTGLFTVIFAIGNLITFVMFPTASLPTIFSIPLGRIYTNTLMDNLLTRESLKAELSRSHGVSEALASVNWPVTESSQATSELLVTSSRQVHVQRTVEETSSPSASSYENTKEKAAGLR